MLTAQHLHAGRSARSLTRAHTKTHTHTVCSPPPCVFVCLFLCSLTLHLPLTARPFPLVPLALMHGCMNVRCCDWSARMLIPVVRCAGCGSGAGPCCCCGLKLLAAFYTRPQILIGSYLQSIHSIGHKPAEGHVVVSHPTPSLSPSCYSAFEPGLSELSRCEFSSPCFMCICASPKYTFSFWSPCFSLSLVS